MFLKKQKIIFLSLIFLAFVLSPVLVFAQVLEIQYPSIPFGAAETPDQFMQKIETGVYPQEYAMPLYIKYFYHLSLMIAGLIALVAIIFGGFQYLISFGAPVKTIIAREQITGGFLSLLLLLSSYLVLALISPQFTVFHISGIEKPDVPEIDIEEFLFATTTYFQIPVGIIIDNAVINEEAQIKLSNAFQAAETTAKSSEELYKISKEIYSLADKANCGKSICNENCSPVGCDGKDNQEEIKGLAEKSTQAVEDLNERREELTMAKIPLIDDLSQIQAAAFLMSLEVEKIFTYNDLLSIRQYPDPFGREIEIDSFPGWEDINIETDGRIIKDPLTFYLDKKGSEDAIYFASTYRWGTYADFPPEPPGGWPPPPPPKPGMLGWPTVVKEGVKITSGYGWRKGKYAGFHAGIDINSSIEGTPVYSAANGTVAFTYYDTRGGNTVIINHPQIGLSTGYVHLQSWNVFPGQNINVGDIIGRVGRTGSRLSGAHLHFEVRNCLAQSPGHFFQSCEPLNPMHYLSVPF